MKRWIHFGLALVLSATATATIGCSAQSDGSSEQGFGSVNLPLVTPMQGTFRLHTATFVIKNQTGTPVATLDSESDPDATSLSAPLPQGDYSVRLQDGWELNSVASDGTESPVHAALLSHNPQSFKINATAATDLSFTFTTEVGTVTIGNGTADISVGVSSSAPLTGCDLTYSYSCSNGQACLVADANGGTFCASAGSLPVGSPCTSEQCVAGSQCLNMDPNNPGQSVCTQFCNTNYTVFGCNCVSLGFTNNSTAGVCGPPPAGACDLLDQTSCSNGQACQYVSGGFGTCGDPGTTPPGSACSSETCTAGYACYGGSCKGICDTRLGSYNHPACPIGYQGYNYCDNVGTGFAGRCAF
jgi:hypothetical protein